MSCGVAGSHCVDPPAPPASSNLVLSWVSTNPPAHTETVLYKCNAGNSYNRFEDDFNRWNYSLTCRPNNTFSPPSWPVCVDVTECPDPSALVTDNMTTTQTFTGNVDFATNVRWVKMFSMR